MQSPWYVSAAAWVLVVVCCPCFVCVSLAVPRRRCGNAARREREKREVQRQAKANKVKPLGRRKRHVSTDPKSRRKDQTNCLLLSRLPLEVRSMIWELVLGGNNYHLVQSRGRIAHVRCEATISDPGRSCCVPAVAYWKTFASRLWDGTRDPRLAWSPQALQEALSNGNLALIRTCRQIYEEAVSIPYTSNIFDVDDPRTLNYFAQTIRTQRLAQVKHLRVHFENHGYSRWGSQYDLFHYATPQGRMTTDIDSIWPTFRQIVLEHMTGLEHLTIVVQQDDTSPYSRFPRLDRVAPWCSSLRELSGLKTFEMSLRQWPGEDLETHQVFNSLVDSLRETILLPPTKSQMANSLS